MLWQLGICSAMQTSWSLNNITCDVQKGMNDFIFLIYCIFFDTQDSAAWLKLAAMEWANAMLME